MFEKRIRKDKSGTRRNFGPVGDRGNDRVFGQGHLEDRRISISDERDNNLIDFYQYTVDFLLNEESVKKLIENKTFENLILLLRNNFNLRKIEHYDCF